MIKHQKLIISFSIVASILCATVMISGCTDYKTYNNNLYAYSVQYPETWDKDTGLESGDVTFTNPEDESNVKLECIKTSYFNLLGIFGIENSFEDIVKLLVSILQEKNDFNVIEEQYTTFNDQEAYEIEYTYSYIRQNYHCKQIYFIDEDYLFALTYEATSDNYDDNLKTADKIMKSFKFNT